MIRRCAAAALAALAVAGAGGAAAAQPVLTPLPGGGLQIDAPPGEWWTCNLLTVEPPALRPLPPIVRYPDNRWQAVKPGRAATKRPEPQGFSTPPAYARFAPRSDVIVQCAGTGLWMGGEQTGS